MSLIGKLYRIEREHKDATPEVRYLARQSGSVPVLAELHAWMLKNAPVVIPKSALGTALTYVGDLWSKLVRYTERGDLPAAKSVDAVDALLPWNLRIADLAGKTGM